MDAPPVLAAAVTVLALLTGLATALLRGVTGRIVVVCRRRNPGETSK